MFSLSDRNKEKNKWMEWTKVIFFALIIALLIRSFIISTSIVEGQSMEPTLEDGEKVILNKVIYRFSKPKRGDIVIIQTSSKHYVKRVIGLPGENIEVNNHALLINGKEYDESYIDFDALNDTGDVDPVQIPGDSYFVMGDNRAISKDSRNGLGLITESEIIGRSEWIIYPFNKFSRIK